jgi:hypothetical protein
MSIDRIHFNESRQPTRIPYVRTSEVTPVHPWPAKHGPAVRKRIGGGPVRRWRRSKHRYCLLCGTSESHTSTHGTDEALSTISTGGTHHALVSPIMAPFLTEM